MAWGLVRQAQADVAGRPVETGAAPLTERVKRILAPARRQDIERQIERHGRPALESVSAALGAGGLNTTEVASTPEGLALRVRPPGGEAFAYELRAVSRPLPAYSPLEAPEPRRSNEWRLVASGPGARRQDITGYTRERIIADVLTQLERWRAA